MKFDHTEVVLGFDGDPLRESGPDELRDVTFRSLVVTVLNNVEDGERMGAEEKARCFHLSSQFFKGKKVDLTVDERAFIKERGGRLLNALAFGRLCEWLEGNPQTVETDEDEADESEAEDDAEEPTSAEAVRSRAKPRKAVHEGRVTTT